MASPNPQKTDQYWEEFGQKDSYWAVLTRDQYKRDTLDETQKADFFSTGATHLDIIWQIITDHLDPSFQPNTALDFGCGVGRVLMPLSHRVKSAYGVDVARSMLAEAGENRDRAGIENVTLLELSEFLDQTELRFDFIHSFIVFQHIESDRGTDLFDQLLGKLNGEGIGALHFTYRVPKQQQKSVAADLIHRLKQIKYQVYCKLNGLPIASNPFEKMLMFEYDLNRIFEICYQHNCYTVYTQFTKHGDYFGIFLFLKKQQNPPLREQFPH